MDKNCNTELLTSTNYSYKQMHDIMNGSYDTGRILNFLSNNIDYMLSEEVLQDYRQAVIDSGIYLIDTNHFDKPVIDIVGTGGDGKFTANISTFASLICAATKLVYVAKYGNKSASGICGSMDIFEELGIEIELSEEQVVERIRNFGIAPLYARFIYPGGRFVAEARRTIGTPTIFNLLFSSSRPFKGKLNLIFGCAEKHQMLTIEKFYQNNNEVKCMIVNGQDGTDEISVSGNGRTNYSLLYKGEVKRGVLDCFELCNIAPKELSLLCVNSKDKAVKLFCDALDPGKSGVQIDALRNAGVVNAGVALLNALGDDHEDPETANKYISLARDVLASGQVMQLVNEMKK